MTPIPTGTNILIKPFIVDMTASGLILSTVQPAPGREPIEEYAEVLAVGPEVKIIKKGDRVYFKEYNLDRIQTGRITQPDIHVFIDEKHVIAVEKKGK